MADQPLRIIFAGTPEFAATALQSLLNSQHQVIAVYSQPDRPAGRGRKLTPSPVKSVAIEAEIPVYQPISLKNQAAQDELSALNADLMIVAAYGLLLPKAVLETPRLGCINIHASILPRWRGAAPIHRALIAGDQETGITIMQMDEGLDTGNMLLKQYCPISAADTSGTLHDRLAELGATALSEVLSQICAETVNAEPQDNDQACYARKLHKAEGNINWNHSAVQLDLQIRGLNPWPVAYTELQGERVRIWAATLDNEQTDQPPGTLISAAKDGLKVATGQGGVVNVSRMQLPGGKQLTVADLLNARQDLFRPGNRFTVES